MKGAKDSRLTKEFILNSISNGQNDLQAQILIFEKYLGITNIPTLIETGEHFINPLRDDAFPTCTFKVYPQTKEPNKYKLWFRDWASAYGLDCFDLVQNMASCGFNEALELIAHHFSLLSAEREVKLKYVMTPAQIVELVKAQAKPINIQVKYDTWTEEHKKFWRQFELTGEDVAYDTFPIKAYWLNDTKFNIPKNVGFCYIFNGKKKLYLPYADKSKKELKFIHESADIVQGEEQLKYDKPILIITSSNKDVKVLRKAAKLQDYNYEVIAPASETTLIPKDRMDFYKTKYTTILLYYNNDEAGKKCADVHSDLYGCSWICNPDGWHKDPSDIVKYKGMKELFYIIENIIYAAIPPF